jgi:hypothetical protein
MKAGLERAAPLNLYPKEWRRGWDDFFRGRRRPSDNPWYVSDERGQLWKRGQFAAAQYNQYNIRNDDE